MFIFFNPNPDRILVGDCVIRALCKLLNEDWDSVYISLCVQGLFVHDMPSGNIVWETYLTNRGYKRSIVSSTCPGCTVKDFCSEHPTGSYLLSIGEHVVTIENGDYYDTWDSGDEHPVYYWSK